MEREFKQKMRSDGVKVRPVKRAADSRPCITIIRAGKHSTCTGDRLPNISQGPEVGLLGLMPMLPEQSIGHLILKVRLQKARLNLMVNNHI